MTTTPLYGKYRATVVNNVDPLQIGRIQAMVPDVAGFVPSTWAMPCVPVAGINTGVFTVPMIGSGVWVEFERGDPDYPVWVGGYWGTAAEVPVLAHTVPPGVSGITLQTPLKNGLVISDVPGPHRGHPDPDHDRRDDLGQRCRDHHFQWQRGRDQHDRAHGRRQSRRLDGDLTMPTSIVVSQSPNSTCPPACPHPNPLPLAGEGMGGGWGHSS